MSNQQRKQRTIERPVAVSGFGYWSGRDITVEFRPARPNTGLVYVRADLPGQPRVPVDVRHRIDMPRRTTLERGSAVVEMVEHINAALVGLRIDNCEVWVDQAEMPGGDGSSQLFVDALGHAGVVVQSAVRNRIVINESLRVQHGEAWIEARPSQEDQLTVSYFLDYPESPAIGSQLYELELTTDNFVNELASARTFLLKHEAEWLRSQGLGARVTFSDLLVFDDNGPIGNELRFVDECVRHKTLDVVGDLALAGIDIVGHIEAFRSGHWLNSEIVRAVLESGKMTNGLRHAA